MTGCVIPFASKRSRPQDQETALWEEDIRRVTAFAMFVAELERFLTHGPLLSSDRWLLQQFCALLDKQEDGA
jgi:hypothetical protein